MTLNVLHLVPDFNYVDGRSYYVYLLLKYLQRNGINVVLCTNKGDSLDRARDIGIPVYTSSSLSFKPFLSKSISFISKIISNHNIQIIHSHHRYSELISNLLRSRKSIHTVTTALSLVSRRYGVEYKSDRIIAVSGSVKKMLVEKFNVAANRISQIPNFADSEDVIDTDQNKPNNRKSRDAEIKILSAGRFHREKNFGVLIEAISLVKDLNIKLTLIGSGNEEANYRKLIASTGINAELIAPQKDLKQFFKDADICILTSRRDPLPTFMLQCGLFGKPFIGSDVDGIAEVIKDGTNGLLFESGNPGELATKIRKFADDRQLAGKCAMELRELVINKFTEKKVIPEILKIYGSFKTGI